MVKKPETGRELRASRGPARRGLAARRGASAEGEARAARGAARRPAPSRAATACGAGRWASGVHRFTGARDVQTAVIAWARRSSACAEDVTVDELAVDGGAPDGDASVDAAAGADDGRLAALDAGEVSLRRPAAPRSAVVEAALAASKEPRRTPAPAAA